MSEKETRIKVVFDEFSSKEILRCPRDVIRNFEVEFLLCKDICIPGIF